jgi:hypothetical protein
MHRSSGQTAAEKPKPGKSAPVAVDRIAFDLDQSWEHCPFRLRFGDKSLWMHATLGADRRSRPRSSWTATFGRSGCNTDEAAVFA